MNAQVLSGRRHRSLGHFPFVRREGRQDLVLLTSRDPEMIERAVRMVFDAKDQYPSQWAAIESIAGKIGCTAETLRRWVRQAERDEGLRPGPTTAEQQRIKELEREVRELRQTNEILKLASAFFAKAELDRHHKK